MHTRRVSHAATVFLLSAFGWALLGTDPAGAQELAQKVIEQKKAEVFVEKIQVDEKAEAVAQQKAALEKKKTEATEATIAQPGVTQPSKAATPEERLEETKAALTTEGAQVVESEKKKAEAAKAEAAVVREEAKVKKQAVEVKRKEAELAKEEAAIARQDAERAKTRIEKSEAADRADAFAERAEIIEQEARDAAEEATTIEEQAKAVEEEAKMHEESAKKAEQQQAAATEAETKAKGEVTWAAKAALVLEEVVDSPDQGIPTMLLDNAKCVVVFPSVVKAGFIVTARYGDGIATCRHRQSGAWGPPAFFSLMGGSFGLQAGAQTADVIMLVMNQKGLEGLLLSSFTLGGSASVTAGPVGRGTSVGTDVLLQSAILTYSRSRGVFAGVDIEGATTSYDEEATVKVYGEELSAEELLFGERDIPQTVRVFTATVNKYAPGQAAEQTLASE